MSKNLAFSLSLPSSLRKLSVIGIARIFQLRSYLVVVPGAVKLLPVGSKIANEL